MPIIQVTSLGEQHGLINSIPNSVPDTDFKNYTPHRKEQLKKEKKEDSKVVRARYINHDEREKGRLSKTYCRYAGEPLQQYHLIHDHEYDLPYGFVKEVNEWGKSMQRSGLQTIDGISVNHDGSPLKEDKPIRTHELVPVAFK